ncbi:acetyltransferase, GNAT family protein [Tritrichomonas foetus]|uniref:Acetyltransferase, GNAT family protein n=1 Tax=Tritrichomonas foetus TaxID=1144522 RepID=A0A1J4KNU9_9EUKA|nr:acetyltransferase, GNAT family protein [Tritrichomonas foetus]|eukprot:OHT12907.1 acetyltransferase, GNAT family protein [Tritrichomonas foetus]
MSQSRWFSRPPHISNMRINPGLRHSSRIWTKPKAAKRPSDFYIDAQLKFVRNFSQAHPQLLMFLNDSKNVFSRQLPNMGSEYVSRLVFDFNAVTVMIMHQGIVNAAICSRVFYKEVFIEIVFCAVESSLQSRGYGRLAMNYLKRVIQIEELYDILTCADNEAVTYFKKQGFNDKAINMDPKRWVGRIKDYEGVTLVHCKIYPDIDYMNFSKTIDDQIKRVEKKIGVRNHKPFFSPNDKYSPYPQMPSYMNKSLIEVIKATDCAERRDEEQRLIERYDRDMNSLKHKLLYILEELKNDEKFGPIFEKPVTEEIAPSYFETIQRPMDFQTIERRLKRYKDYYKRPEIFAADIHLMCDNCKIFNSAETHFYKTATQCMQKFKHLYNATFPELQNQ